MLKYFLIFSKKRPNEIIFHTMLSPTIRPFSAYSSKTMRDDFSSQLKKILFMPRGYLCTGANMPSIIMAPPPVPLRSGGIMVLTSSNGTPSKKHFHEDVGIMIFWAYHLMTVISWLVLRHLRCSFDQKKSSSHQKKSSFFDHDF